MTLRTHRRAHRLAAAAAMCVLVLARTAAAGEPANRYHLFRPVPVEEMRELSTDRPDQTESPYTVDAGHYQLEVDLVNLGRDTRSVLGPGPGNVDVRTERLGVAATNLKVGVTNRVDLQLIAPWYERERRLGSSFPDESGLGDVTVRLKANVWGDDGGSSAMALMPFVTLPTSAYGDPVVGSSVLFALGLPHGFDLGSMVEAELGDTGVLLGTLTVGHALRGPLGGYLEVARASAIHAHHGVPEATVNSGLTWALSRDVQLDGGVLVGLTEQAEDFSGFVGFSVRR